MTDKELALLEQLVHALGQNTAATVDAYVVWFIASAITWCLVGVAFVAVGYHLWKQAADEDTDNPIAWRIATAASLFVAVLFIGNNLPDLFAPRAIAVHQLLKDVVP